MQTQNICFRFYAKLEYFFKLKFTKNYCQNSLTIRTTKIVYKIH
jgi:hypothetical protein